jgi:hypothetical protein
MPKNVCTVLGLITASVEWALRGVDAIARSPFPMQIINHISSQLAPWKFITLVVLLALTMVAGTVHQIVVARASRLRDGSDVGNRLFPYGLGAWNIGMLRRQYYTGKAAKLYRLSVRTYVTTISLLTLWWLMGVIWWIFKL